MATRTQTVYIEGRKQDDISDHAIDAYAAIGVALRVLSGVRGTTTEQDSELRYGMDGLMAAQKHVFEFIVLREVTG